MLIKKQKSYVRLCRVINGIPEIIKTIKLKKETQDEIRYQERTYIIQRNQYTYKIKNLVYYFVNIDNEATLTFNELATPLTPEELDMILNRKVIGKVTGDLDESTFTIETKNLILGSLIGVGLMGFVMMLLMYIGVL